MTGGGDFLCRYLPRDGPTTHGVRASIVTRTATIRMADMVRRKASFIFALPSKPAPIIRRCVGTLAQRSCRYRDPAHLQRGAINGPLAVSQDHQSVPVDTVC